MPYRIQPDEVPKPALRRIGEEQVTRAMEDPEEEDPHEAVHECRKRCKKIRALLRGVPNRSAISGLVTRRRAELQAQARPLGERLFAEQPGRLVNRFQAYWAAGRQEAILHSTLEDVALGALS